MSEERMDAVLRELSAHPIQTSTFYENHYDEIVQIEERCLVEVDWDDIRIKDVRVTELGRQFLMRGGFKEEARQRKITEERDRAAESAGREQRSSTTIERYALYVALGNLFLLCYPRLQGIISGGIDRSFSFLWECVKWCWRALSDLF